MNTSDIDEVTVAILLYAEWRGRGNVEVSLSCQVVRTCIGSFSQLVRENLVTAVRNYRNRRTVRRVRSLKSGGINLDWEIFCSNNHLIPADYVSNSHPMHLEW